MFLLNWDLFIYICIYWYPISLF